MKYKEGDRVKIKSLDWYNQNKDEDGDVPGAFFDAERTKYCGKVVTIDGNGYRLGSGTIIYAIKEGYEWIGERAIEGLSSEDILSRTAYLVRKGKEELDNRIAKHNAYVDKCFPADPTYTDKGIPNDMNNTKTDMDHVSDGYHTFNELYEYRLLYNAAFFNELAKQGLYDVHKSKRHSNGEIPFGDPNWFIVVAELPTGQISNHYEMKDWFLFQVPEKELSNEYDGHSPADVAERLRQHLEKM